VFKLDAWSVDEYYVDCKRFLLAPPGYHLIWPFSIDYETGTTFSLQIFQAHIYYRSLSTVSSLITSWLQDCKDRQLTSSFTTLTSIFFSPLIINAELSHLKSSAVLEQLETDSLKIKVSMAISEVTATYLVDEQNLEIKLRIPPDWPLHKIDIRDVKKVGVDENRWRAWVFGVRAVIGGGGESQRSGGGRLIDGLEVFKKNCVGHFEGQAECAICYS
jgi:E3 ubiquitin-protein ligase listerin